LLFKALKYDGTPQPLSMRQPATRPLTSTDGAINPGQALGRHLPLMAGSLIMAWIEGSVPFLESGDST